MPTIIFVSSDGSTRSVQAQPGRSVMRAALDNDVPGIVAECGGNAMCATCHVYAEPDAAALLDPIEDDEEEMLDSTAAPREECSRLSCQLTVGGHWDHVTFRVPKTQL